MIEGLDKLLNCTGEPGVSELRSVLLNLLGRWERPVKLFAQIPLRSEHRRVYRLRFTTNGQVGSIIIKRLEPSIAQRNQLVASRWLPAVGLGNTGAVMLGAAAEHSGECIWQIYEDLGAGTLDPNSSALSDIKLVIELIAQVHLRFADHPLLAECRLYGGDLGTNFFASNVSDALRCLQAVQRSRRDLPAEHARVIETLLNRLHRLVDEHSGRAQALEELGGPETLLHGDLWTSNTIIIPTAEGFQARLIDWDHAGVGPISYDLSTFLLRFPNERRWQILELYGQAVADAGWRLPPCSDLNALFETAEYARFANRIIWPAISLARGEGEWGFAALAEVKQWFEEFQPVLPERKAASQLSLNEIFDCKRG